MGRLAKFIYFFTENTEPKEEETEEESEEEETED